MFHTPLNKLYEIWGVNPQRKTFYAPPDGGGLGRDFYRENVLNFNTAVNLWVFMKRNPKAQEHPEAQ